MPSAHNRKIVGSNPTRSTNNFMTTKFLFHVFEVDKYIKWKDIERCLYPPFRNHPNFLEWIEKDNERLLLIALDRYADKLQNK